MANFRAIAALFLSLTASGLVAGAQQVTLARIEFVGDPIHTAQELLAFSGLKPGPSTQQAVQDAAQRLNDTGLFDEVNFSSMGSSVTYTLKPAPPSSMYPARFSNFPWWSDDDLDLALHRQVPLYRRDGVPPNGSIRDSVVDTLSRLVAAKGVTGPSVISLLTASHPGVKPDILTFQISAPAVLVRSVNLQAASAAMQPRLQVPIAALAGQPWDENTFPGLIDSRIGEAYRENGFLDIAIERLQTSAPAISPGGIELYLSATVSEGPQYRVSQLTWAGSPELPVAEFAKAAELKPGAIASSGALRNTLHAVEVAYSAQGYLGASITAPAQIDRSAHTVAYEIAAHPGPQYHLKTLHWSGLSDSQMQAFQSRWRLAPGDIYDASYPIHFVQQNATLIPPGTRPGFEVRTNSGDHTVDLTVSFSRGPQPPH